MRELHARWNTLPIISIPEYNAKGAKERKEERREAKKRANNEAGMDR